MILGFLQPVMVVVFLKHGGFKANELQCSLVGGGQEDSG